MPRTKSKSNDVTDIAKPTQSQLLTILEISELDFKLRFQVAESYDKNGFISKCKYIMQDNGINAPSTRKRLIGLNTARDEVEFMFRHKTAKYSNETKFVIHQLIRTKTGLIVQGICHGKDFANNVITNAFTFGKLDKPIFQKHYEGFDSTTGAVIDAGMELSGFTTEHYIPYSKEQVEVLSKNFDDEKLSLIIDTGARKMSVPTLEDFCHESFSELRQALLPKSKSIFDKTSLQGNTAFVGEAAK